jgi:hypothetical protein
MPIRILLRVRECYVNSLYPACPQWVVSSPVHIPVFPSEETQPGHHHHDGRDVHRRALDSSHPHSSRMMEKTTRGWIGCHYLMQVRARRVESWGDTWAHLNVLRLELLVSA